MNFSLQFAFCLTVVRVCVCVCVLLFSLRAAFWQNSSSDYVPAFAGTFIISPVRCFQKSLAICNGGPY